MTQKTYNLISALLFAAIAVVHILRLYFGWEGIIGGVMIPTWPSMVAIGVGGYLGFCGFKLS